MSFTNVLAATSSFSSDSGYSRDSSANPEAVLAVLGAFLGFFIIIGLLAILFLIARGKVFQKAGKPFWASFMSGYDMVLSFEIASKPGWWALVISLSALITIIPLLGLLLWLILVAVLYIMQSLSLAKNFGKSGVFGFFLLFLLPFIGYSILGFGSAKYQPSGNSVAPDHGADKTPEVFANNNSSNTTPPQSPSNLVQ